MVETAAGAGTGGLKIRGSLDTSMIERGFTRVKQGFASVKGFAKGFTADLQRMSQSAKDLSGKLITVGGIGGAAIIGLASKAPAVAPALAKIGVTMGKLSRTMGESLAPAFENVSNWLDKLSGWAGEHPDIFSGIVLSLTTIAALKFVGATGLLTALGSLIIAPATLTALGYIAAIGLAGYAGYKAAEAIIDKLQTYTGMGTDPDAPTDMSGQTLISRIPQKIWSDITGKPTPWEDPLNPLSPAHQREMERIKEEGFRPTPGGTISAAREEDRRFFLLSWWDALWG